MCAATKGGLSLADVDVTKEAVIQGRVLRGGNPVAGAYVRLLDSGGEFTAEVQACKHWPDTLATTIVLRLCDARVQSVAESRTMFLCWDQHLPRPEPQVPILDESGWIFAYADFAWEEEGVFLEFDGRIKYERFRREGETLEQTAVREVLEETGLNARQHRLTDWHLSNEYEIFPEWRWRYAPEVTHNTEHVFGLEVAAPIAVRLAPREHLGFVWLPWQEAAQRCFSWSNAAAIRKLQDRSSSPPGAETECKRCTS